MGHAPAPVKVAKSMNYKWFISINDEIKDSSVMMKQRFKKKQKSTKKSAKASNLRERHETSHYLRCILLMNILFWGNYSHAIASLTQKDSLQNDDNMTKQVY